MVTTPLAFHSRILINIALGRSAPKNGKFPNLWANLRGWGSTSWGNRKRNRGLKSKLKIRQLEYIQISYFYKIFGIRSLG